MPGYNQKQSGTQTHRQLEERETKGDRDWASRYRNSQIQAFKVTSLTMFQGK